MSDTGCCCSLLSSRQGGIQAVCPVGGRRRWGRGFIGCWGRWRVPERLKAIAPIGRRLTQARRCCGGQDDDGELDLWVKLILHVQIDLTGKTCMVTKQEPSAGIQQQINRNIKTQERHRHSKRRLQQSIYALLLHIRLHCLLTKQYTSDHRECFHSVSSVQDFGGR